MSCREIGYADTQIRDICNAFARKVQTCDQKEWMPGFNPFPILNTRVIAGHNLPLATISMAGQVHLVRTYIAQEFYGFLGMYGHNDDNGFLRQSRSAAIHVLKGARLPNAGRNEEIPNAIIYYEAGNSKVHSLSRYDVSLLEDVPNPFPTLNARGGMVGDELTFTRIILYGIHDQILGHPVSGTILPD